MGIVELLTAIGDENIGLQNLDRCADALNYSAKKGTKITFGTEQPLTPNGTRDLGFIIWLDRETVKRIMSKDAPHAD